jgi:hypothetical protein
MIINPPVKPPGGLFRGLIKVSVEIPPFLKLTFTGKGYSPWWEG